jgi:hypothetical protein
MSERKKRQRVATVHTRATQATSLQQLYAQAVARANRGIEYKAWKYISTNAVHYFTYRGAYYAAYSLAGEQPPTIKGPKWAKYGDDSFAFVRSLWPSASIEQKLAATILQLRQAHRAYHNGTGTLKAINRFSKLRKSLLRQAALQFHAVASVTFVKKTGSDVAKHIASFLARTKKRKTKKRRR